VSSKSSSHCCCLRVPCTPLEWQTVLPFPYDLSSLQDLLHMICTQCVAPTSCLGHPVYTQIGLIRGVTECLCDANVNSHTHNRIGLHCSHKSKTSCPTPALL
jgi:hypothetical protein